MFAFGGKKEQKPLCQCPVDKFDDPCKKEAKDGSLFCEDHQDCKKPPTTGFEPKYIPEVLNKMKSYVDTHNCFSYALRGNKINKELMKQCNDVSNCDANFEQPGAASGQRKAMRKEELRTCPVVEKLTKADLSGDFIDSSFYKPCPAGFSKVAMVADKGTDYHWYSQKKDGTWSHKDGSNPVKDFDAKKRKIFNPKQASRNYGKDLNYEDFCGFYCVRRTKKITLKQGGKRKGGSRKHKGGSSKSARKTRRQRR
jgi:hypothetical protein